MRSLFWKGMLAFLAVIVVAVGTVAALTGHTTETEFRRYALTRSGMWEEMTTPLVQYYEAQGSWTGLQDALARSHGREGRTWGKEIGNPGDAWGAVAFRIIDVEGCVVADSEGTPRGSVPRGGLNNAVPIQLEDQVVGYLLPSLENPPTWPLDAGQAEFLDRVRRTLWIGALAALTVASVIGGLLFRSITAPLRQLTSASQAIAQGDLSARAAVRGEDEVAQLAEAFNSMTRSLARMEKARRNQTADIAHELRTPLTVLQGTLEAMLDGVYAVDQQNLEAALAQTRTLSRLIEDLRILALADAGKLHLAKDAVDLVVFLEESVEAYRASAREKGIALALEMSADLPTVLADPDRLAQVMGNLLTNSLQYVPAGGHVTVAAEMIEQEVVVTVEDDGPGIPPEDSSHIFERFWRADVARQRASGGSGLGLSIAAQIVEAHGGRIWAQETPGGGLTVRFSLPRLDSDL